MGSHSLDLVSNLDEWGGLNWPKWFIMIQVNSSLDIAEFSFSFSFFFLGKIDITGLSLVHCKTSGRVLILFFVLHSLLQQGMGIYDAMKLCKADVSTICLGLAASMGAFLLAAGSKGKRYCMPNARVMIHQPLGTAGGKVSIYHLLL